VKVLFLGGPWHDRREDVALPLPEVLCVPIPVGQVVGWSADAEPPAPEYEYCPGYVRYQLMSVTQRWRDTPPGHAPRWPVYVAPDYTGPARH